MEFVFWDLACFGCAADGCRRRKQQSVNEGLQVIGSAQDRFETAAVNEKSLTPRRGIYTAAGSTDLMASPTSRTKLLSPCGRSNTAISMQGAKQALSDSIVELNFCKKKREYLEVQRQVCWIARPVLMQIPYLGFVSSTDLCCATERAGQSQRRQSSCEAKGRRHQQGAKGAGSVAS